MPFKVVRGVYVVGGPELTCPLDAYSYLVVDERGDNAVLIDSGCGMAPVEVLRNILELGVRARSVKYLILTHAHVDHAGGGAYFYSALGVQTLAHEPDAKAIRHGDRAYCAVDVVGAAMKPYPVSVCIRRGDYQVSAGDLELRILHTPGHTAGSISVIVELWGVKVAFTGDLDGVLSSSWQSDEHLWSESIKRVIEERPDVVCAGHWYSFRGVEMLEEVVRAGPVWLRRCQGGSLSPRPRSGE